MGRLMVLWEVDGLTLEEARDVIMKMLPWLEKLREYDITGKWEEPDVPDPGAGKAVKRKRGRRKKARK